MGTKLEVGVDGWSGLWLTKSRTALFTESGNDRLQQAVPQVSHDYARMSLVRESGMSPGTVSLNFYIQGPEGDMGIEAPVRRDKGRGGK